MSSCNAIQFRERLCGSMAQLCISCFRAIVVVTGVFYFLAPAENCYSDQPAMEVLFLGTGGPRPDGRAACCNLILFNGRPRFFVDVGSGAFARLGELHLDIDKVDTIFLTHLHVDHTGDLPEDTNLLVFNCAVLDPPGSPPELYNRHSPPKRIGELARSAHVRRLISTHIPPTVDRAEKQVSSSIGAQTDIQMSFAEDKMRVTP